jgi:hypothetical protein
MKRKTTIKRFLGRTYPFQLDRVVVVCVDCGREVKQTKAGRLLHALTCWIARPKFKSNWR